jgi:hypothetical protein
MGKNEINGRGCSNSQGVTCSTSVIITGGRLNPEHQLLNP